VTADTSQRSQFLTPPADAFFETTIVLRGLTVEEQRELLRRRLGDDWRAASPLIGEERDNPRRLLTVAREAVVDERPIEDVLRASGARRADWPRRQHDARRAREPRAPCGRL
jgi:hypothetical protein